MIEPAKWLSYFDVEPEAQLAGVWEVIEPAKWLSYFDIEPEAQLAGFSQPLARL